MNKRANCLEQVDGTGETNGNFTVDPCEIFELSDCEVETLRRAAEARKLPYDPLKRKYNGSELQRYGLVREGYTRQELRDRGIGPGAVTSFDELAKEAPNLLPVETPFGKGIRKWQLPIDMMPLRIFQTVFPPGSHVSSHVHPPHSDDAPGGGLRIITRGSINYKGKKFGPGDWFFAPNGEPYEFDTDPDVETVVFYKYAFFAIEQGNRFSHPHACEADANAHATNDLKR
ncbi:Uncharacterised protein [Burkholderia pseudomallei]|uniref:hypothetical protein n=1 Tax=Burkholderia pseudomallei TaxID=28450 RepID=UPI000F2B1E42|nr:hypothetical protein [Burkholderia pseudomallei]CAJ2754506.1 Uncharacterised protein [Burkholderia pseudomallei]VCJ93080.1 Uncharacterised protein [Burkholderia pseudomallei]VCJ95175.1 Uncharacterised protein [Burkholderia pseudomallei]VCJ95519.1 Uncharacterised protein [Burkholderia pseudomallei]VCJ97808.1 Uncharacterised protein [Burkholderia pseudomallei]